MLVVIVVTALVGLAVSVPHEERTLSYEPISAEDREFLRTLPSHRGSYPAGFKETYLARDGTLTEGSRPAGECLKVIGSPHASLRAVRLVAQDIHKMLRYSPSQVFSNMARHHVGMGIFRRTEKLTIFPEYAHLRDTPQCQGRCDGACSRTCTFDGRKWDNVAGIGGSLALVLEENVLCDHDPYYNHDNIAVHEFGHAVDGYGFDSHMKTMKNNAFQHARTNSLWRSNAYSMSNSAEYFGEATGAFFMVNRQSSPGGMNECYGTYRYCRTEMEAREHLKRTDRPLYDLLVLVYTDNRPGTPSALTVCPPNSPVG